MSYRPQVKQPNGQMVDIPLDAETVKGKNVSAEINNIISGAQVVGNATHAASADAATKASQDASGNDIVATYATKSELAAAGQFDPNGTYPNLKAGNATHAASADAATKASQDGNGNNIASTYATKREIKKLYTHILHVVFSGDSNEYIIRYDTPGKTSITDLMFFYYSIYKGAISSDTGYPINIKIGNEYISGVVYASKINNQDALSFYYNGKTKTYKTTSDISIIRDAVIDWQ